MLCCTSKSPRVPHTAPANLRNGPPCRFLFATWITAQVHFFNVLSVWLQIRTLLTVSASGQEEKIYFHYCRYFRRFLNEADYNGAEGRCIPSRASPIWVVLLVFIFQIWLSLATMQTINVSSGPRVTWPLVSVTPGAGGHTPGPRGVATDLGMESFDFHQLGTWDLSKGIWEEELDINLVWSLVTAGGASWTLHSTVSTGICECLH